MATVPIPNDKIKQLTDLAGKRHQEVEINMKDILKILGPTHVLQTNPWKHPDRFYLHPMSELRDQLDELPKPLARALASAVSSCNERDFIVLYENENNDDREPKEESPDETKKETVEESETKTDTPSAAAGQADAE
jgi:hypothetical protein